jgi:hypothetical protein
MSWCDDDTLDVKLILARRPAGRRRAVRESV